MKLIFNNGITKNGNNFTIGSNGRIDIQLESTEQDFTLEFEIQTSLVSDWNAPIELRGPTANYNVQNAGYAGYYSIYWGGNQTRLGEYTTSKKAYYSIKKEGTNLRLFLRLETGETYTFNAVCTEDVTVIYIGNYNQANKTTGSITNLNFLDHKSKKYYFKASLQNTLIPEIGSFSNEGSREGTFTLQDGEYSLSNPNSAAFREYTLTEDTDYKNYIIEFDILAKSSSGYWYFLFNGNSVNGDWWGVAYSSGFSMVFTGNHYELGTTYLNRWHHIKIENIYTKGSTYTRNYYVDGSLVFTHDVSDKFNIQYLDLLGNSGGYVPDGSLKNIEIYSIESGQHYLNKEGLKQVWKNIKDYHEASLSNYYTKAEVESLISNISGVGTQEVFGMQVLDDDGISTPTRVIEDTVDDSVNTFTNVENADEVEIV